MDVGIYAVHGQNCVEDVVGRRDGREPVHSGWRVQAGRIRGQVGDGLAL